MDLTPRKTVEELDRYIIGQGSAKKAIATALRNRWRRQQLPPHVAQEIVPKNILMIGPTGVGKTEISRRIAKLIEAPFIKVEATKFTEIGYVGRDVEQIIRDLVDLAIKQLKDKKSKETKDKALQKAEQDVLDALVGDKATQATRDKYLQDLREGLLDDKMVKIKVKDNRVLQMPELDIPGLPPGTQMGMLNLNDVFSGALGQNTKMQEMTVRQSYDVFIEQATEAMINPEKIKAEAINLVENQGIVFIDEIDKICARGSERTSGEVSREGVQRDLLPLIEGTSVTTKHGVVKTDFILFVASGAFHIAKPSDLLPELQGRLPVRVCLEALTEDDFRRILCEPEVNLIEQYKALIKTEGVTLLFEDNAISEIARISTHLNNIVENVGARRLHTVMERLLEDVSFEAGEGIKSEVVIDKVYVEKHVSGLLEKPDLSEFIL